MKHKNEARIAYAILASFNVLGIFNFPMHVGKNLP